MTTGTKTSNKLIISEAMNNWPTGNADFTKYVSDVKALIDAPIVSSNKIKKWIEKNEVMKFAWEMESLTILLGLGDFENINDFKGTFNQADKNV